MDEVQIRALRLPEDAQGLRELDTSFTTDVVYEVVLAEDAVRLVPTRVTPPVTKRFPLDDLEDSARGWDSGHVAVERGRVCGFLATGYEAWNRRLTIRHLYVDHSRRRRGIGRRLGFELCGLDTTLYRGTPSEGETALFLAQSLAR